MRTRQRHGLSLHTLNIWPPKSYSLFWDTGGGSFDAAEYPDYTILRVLELGDEEAVAWLRGKFEEEEEEEIRRVVRTEWRLSPKSATHWALMYGIPEEQVAALVPR
jgi:hypothetical protein